MLYNYALIQILCAHLIFPVFTNVPLKETIDICTDSYEGDLTPPPFPRDVFVKLMVLCTSSVEFSFKNIMYSQVDGVQMGRPLGPVLAGIFVGYYKSLLFDKVSEPFIYFRYVDDAFATFSTESEAVNFFNKFNSLDRALSFTMEVERIIAYLFGTLLLSVVERVSLRVSIINPPLLACI